MRSIWNAFKFAVILFLLGIGGYIVVQIIIPLAKSK